MQKVSLTNSTILFRNVEDEVENSNEVENYYNLSTNSSGFSSLSGVQSPVNGNFVRKPSQIFVRTKFDSGLFPNADSGIGKNDGNDVAEGDTEAENPDVESDLIKDSQSECETGLTKNAENQSKNDSGFVDDYVENSTNFGESNSTKISRSNSTKSNPGAKSDNLFHSDSISDTSSTSSPSNTKKCVIRINEDGECIKRSVDCYEEQDVSVWLSEDEDDPCEEIVIWRCTGTGIKRRTWIRKWKIRKGNGHHFFHIIPF